MPPTKLVHRIAQAIPADLFDVQVSPEYVDKSDMLMNPKIFP
jgi:hypothetical protein